jgi:hypothetical protein
VASDLHSHLLQAHRELKVMFLNRFAQSVELHS